MTTTKLKHWGWLLGLLAPFAVIGAIAGVCIVRMGPTSAVADAPYERVIQAVNQTIPAYKQIPADSRNSDIEADSIAIVEQRREGDGAKTVFVIRHPKWFGRTDKFADASSVAVIRKNDGRTRIEVVMDYGLFTRSRHHEEERAILNSLLAAPANSEKSPPP